jgi:hypothetical protein
MGSIKYLKRVSKPVQNYVLSFQSALIMQNHEILTIHVQDSTYHMGFLYLVHRSRFFRRIHRLGLRAISLEIPVDPMIFDLFLSILTDQKRVFATPEYHAVCSLCASLDSDDSILHFQSLLDRSDLPLLLECYAATLDANPDASVVEDAIAARVNDSFVRLSALPLGAVARILAKAARFGAINQHSLYEFLSSLRATRPIALLPLRPFLRPSNLPLADADAVRGWREIAEHYEAVGCRSHLALLASQSAADDALRSLVAYVVQARPFGGAVEFESGGDLGSSVSGCVVIPDCARAIGAKAFAGASTLRTILMSPVCGVEAIGAKAFARSAVTALTVPRSVRVIKAGAFLAAAELSRVVFAADALLERIGRQAFSETGLTVVLFPASLARIGDAAFAQCARLNSVTWAPASRLAALGERCFAECAIGAVSLPAGLRCIGARAFARCGDLRAVEFAERASIDCVGAAAFRRTLVQSVVVPCSVRVIGERAFANCAALARVDFARPSSVAVIGREAFLQCPLASLWLPPGVSTLDRGAFRECRLAAVEIEMESRLARIADAAFAGCPLEEFFVPPACADVDRGAFAGCAQLTRLMLSSAAALAPACLAAFAPLAIDGLWVGGAATRIPPRAFSGNASLVGAPVWHLRELALREPLVHIGSDAFRGQTDIPRVEIPASVTAIGAGAFADCRSLAAVVCELGSRLDAIGNAAFARCTLIAFAVPARLRRIGSDAFADCAALADLVVPINAALAEIGDGAFAGCAIGALELPAALVAVGRDAFARCPLAMITVGANSAMAPSVLAGFAEFAIATLVFADVVTEVRDAAFMNWRALADVRFGAAQIAVVPARAFENCPIVGLSLPNSVVVVGERAFAGGRLDYLTIERGSRLRTIGAQAFLGCHFPALTLRERVEEIDESAFEGCEELRRILVSSLLAAALPCTRAFARLGVLEVGFTGMGTTAIGRSAFRGWAQLSAVGFSAESVVEIEDEAFDGTGIKEVVFPATLRRIGRCAFGRCHNLALIGFPADGAGIAIGELAFAECPVDSLTIPAAVESIAADAFDGCRQLNAVVFLARVLGPAVTAAFRNVPHVKICTIGQAVAELAPGAFARFPFLERLVLAPDGRLQTIHAEACEFIPHLTAVRIPNDVTEIGEGAFQGCTSLRTVIFCLDSQLKTIGPRALEQCALADTVCLPARLECIGDAAFAANEALERITIPASVTTVGNLAFSECARLSAVDVEAGSNLCCLGADLIPRTARGISWRFNDCIHLVEIGASAFRRAPIEKILIPAAVRVIRDSAFAECERLSVVNFPAQNQLRSIGARAFTDCPALREFLLTPLVEWVADDAFVGCTNLRSLMFKSDPMVPASVTAGFFALRGDAPCSLAFFQVRSIGTEAFRSFCIASVGEWDHLEAIDDRAFEGAEFRVRALTFPASLHRIGVSAFASTKGLEKVRFTSLPGLSLCDGAFSASEVSSVAFPPGVTIIGEAAFGNTRLTSLTVPQSVEHMGGAVFSGCLDLRRVVFDAGFSLPIIAASAFIGCAVARVEIPASVLEIGGEAFAGCHSLSQVAFQAARSLQRIRAGAFRGCAIETLELPPALEEIAEGAFASCAALKVVRFAPSAPFKSLGGDVFAGCSRLQRVVFPKAIMDIAASAFDGCQALAIVEFAQPSAFQLIGDFAFRGTALRTLGPSAGTARGTPPPAFSLPPTFRRIGRGAFDQCRALTSKALLESTNLREIPDEAFRGCHIEAVVLPATIERIGCSAFASCAGLRSITVPAAVVEIGAGAFVLCTALRSVEFATESRLERIADAPDPVLGAFARSGVARIVLPQSLQILGAHAFSDCRGLTDLRIDATQIRIIGEGVCLSCRFRDVMVPATVTEICADAFSHCTAITSVQFRAPAAIRIIGARAFEACGRLGHIGIPKSVTEIKTRAFAECHGLETVTFTQDAAFTELGDEAFVACGMKRIEIPFAIENFGVRVFAECRALGEIRFAREVAIGHQAFAENPLTTLHLPDSMAGPGWKTGRQSYAEFLGSLARQDLRDAFPPVNAIRNPVYVTWSPVRP